MSFKVLKQEPTVVTNLYQGQSGVHNSHTELALCYFTPEYCMNLVIKQTQRMNHPSLV